ncbi:hypothetical protein CANCADRAFT_22444 [Tortispora caseinolytica NRRL Y-17796]|uniref:Sm protein F n=1 Tax=Tortispora caseinolytica NRRL Y-17796 TaxID=767744 RepID=A0A1E4TLD1_9ASCO|nr:hypothetical protein CANCADRAFT_22444 [Tortispora caseinolytica NRRL Y-17796]
MSLDPINPNPFMQNLVGKPVIVRLKWNRTEYRGTLLSIDSYMNIQMDDAIEYIAGDLKGPVGEIMIRCNNVLWVSDASSKSDGKAVEQ